MYQLLAPHLLAIGLLSTIGGVLLLRVAVAADPVPPGMRRLLWFAGAVYVACIVAVTLTRVPSAAFQARPTHFMPFADLPRQLTGPYSHGTVAVVQLAGNLLMLAPLGALVPIVQPRLRRPRTLIAAGFITALAIETSQFVLGTGRVAHVDDVLLNTLGVGIGYLG